MYRGEDVRLQGAQDLGEGAGPEIPHGCHLTRDNWRQRLARLGEATAPLLELTATAVTEYQALSDSLLVVEPPAYPTREQLAARYLARCGRPLTPGELRDALARRGHIVSAAQLKRDMLAHRAFVRAPGDLWTIGRPVLRRQT
ncbi:hypothetical protein AB0G54_42465 [Streptomyces yokosukanensis]|uniref:hypothetical protein n=1 Tax=Streptomyces yokosukanensis TaxID=67386 RepID=UPI00342EF6E0